MTYVVPHVLAFAVRNIVRQRARSAATLAAITMGILALILAKGFVQDIFVQLGEAVIHSQSGHLQIAHQGYREGYTRAPEAYLIDRPEALEESLRQEEQVQLAFSRLNFAGTVSNGKRDLGIIGEGIDPSAEAVLGSYLRYSEGRPLAQTDRDGIVLGQGVAKTLGLKPGDRVNLVISLTQGAVNTLDFEVVGVFQSFSKEFDARSVRIPLAAARDLMQTDAAHLVVVLLKQTVDTDLVQAALQKKLGPAGYEVNSWRQLSDFYDKTIALYDSQFGVLRLIILLMVLLSVVNSVNMTLFERTREFGTLMALGNRRSQVFLFIVTESALLGLAGAAVGMTVGCVTAWIISAIGIPMPPPPNANIGYLAAIRLVPIDILAAGCVGFLATCVASLLPAYRASRMPVVDALRRGC